MTRRPNILLITSDQQHFSTLGVVNPRISTPALDRLCREGTRFDRAYCPNPTCTPTRASIITGLYPSEHGAWSLGTKLPEDVPTLGDALTRRGYRTALIGKAHFQPLASTPEQTSIESYPILRDLDFWRDFHGPWYGFEHVETCRNHADEAHVGQHYAIWMEEQGFTQWRDYFQPWPAKNAAEQIEAREQYVRPGTHGSWTLPEELHYTTWTGERTCARLGAYAESDERFFLWSSFHDPHPPYLVPEPWANIYDPAEMQPGRLTPGELDDMPPHHRMTQDPDADWSIYQETPHGNHGFADQTTTHEQNQRDMAVYYGMTSFMDQQIGRILDRLDTLGLADNTLVVFSTDHGHFLGQHGLTAKGAFPYEDLIRVPFIVRWPGGGVKGSATSDALQSLVDLPRTFLSAAGTDPPIGMQGVDQLDAWRGGAPARDTAVVEFRHQPTAVHLRTYVTDRYKLTVYRGRDYGELFDLREDPGELHNLWADDAYAEVKARLFERAVQAELTREPMKQPRISGA